MCLKYYIYKQMIEILKSITKEKIEREYKFHPSRKWRFDFAIVQLKIAIEIEGGIFTYGRHNRPIGYIKDLEKYNAATEAGWSILRYQPNKINYEQILRCIELKKKLYSKELQ